MFPNLNAFIIMEIKELYKRFLKHPAITTDTRNCLPGSIFIALKGNTFNGNAFAQQALEKGCAYAIVDEPQHADSSGKTILVENCLKTLQQLANYHRRQMNVPVIGITGTNGKTTTKELTAAVLSTRYNLLYTQGNLNNHIGVPLTLLRLNPAHEMAIIEMGASHPGDIKELAEIAEPDYGIITNVGKAHLEGFGSFENVVRTKGELYDFLRTRKHATAFVCNENAVLLKAAKGLHTARYGQTKGLYVEGHMTNCSPCLCLEWKHEGESSYHPVQTNLIGSYNLENVLAAIAIGTYFNITPDAISRALTGYVPQNNRSQLKNTNRNQLIIDAYNANPTSMMAALQNFRHIAAEHKMAILGDMKELGADSQTEHQKIVDYLVECHFEKTILVGDQFQSTTSSFNTFPDTSALIQELKKNAPKGYWILIKGSNSMKMAQIADYL